VDTDTGAGTGQVSRDALDRHAPDNPEELALAADFPVPDRATWTAAVDAVLRRSGRLDDAAEPGAGVDALTWTTLDGVRVAPLFTADDVTEPPALDTARRAAGWDVRQRHAHTDPARAGEAILADLANGATSIWLAVGPVGTAVADLPAVLDGVFLDLAPVVLDAAACDLDTELRGAEAFLRLAEARGVDPAALRGTLGLDPIGRRARTGSGPDPESVVPLALRVARDLPQARAIVVDALPVHVAGGSDAHELAYALAAGVGYLRVLVAAGLDVATAARLLEFRLAATAEQFPTIAKLRAARLLWGRVLGAGGMVEAPPQILHAVAAPTMYTRRDPYTNLLRGTVAGFAAGVGGADAVTVPPFDAALGSPTAFSRRVARNTQSLLLREAHLAWVADPAGGSWFVESLTDALARAAWAVFQELEEGGGVIAALDSGLVAEQVSRVRAAREHEVAVRRRPLIGVSEFADLHDGPPTRTGPTLLDELGVGGAGGLPVYRPAAGYEGYRDRSDALLADTGARPRVFLATLGPLAVHAARAGYARNLLHAGGIETVDAGPTSDDAEVVAAFRAAETPVAVLCSSDAVYAERAEAVVAALRAAGARQVLLAGTTLVAGLDGHLADGDDALAAYAAVYALVDDRAVGAVR
jgi:methylmalonyl-CoA mutase